MPFLSSRFFHPARAVLLAGIFFTLDRFLKHAALSAVAKPHLWGAWIGWEPFLNSGVAFGIPLPGYVVITVTIPILAALVVSFVRRAERAPPASPLRLAAPLYGMALVAAGALSNLVDRLTLGVTVDYFRLLTAIINLADVLIVAGLAVWAWHDAQPARTN